MPRSSFANRIKRLEQHTLISNAKPALVQIRGPGGPSAEQIEAVALAKRNGVIVVIIDFKDGRLPGSEEEANELE